MSQLSKDFEEQAARAWKECKDAGCELGVPWKELSPAARAAWRKHFALLGKWFAEHPGLSARTKRIVKDALEQWNKRN